MGIYRQGMAAAKEKSFSGHTGGYPGGGDAYHGSDETGTTFQARTE